MTRLSQIIFIVLLLVAAVIAVATRQSIRVPFSMSGDRYQPWRDITIDDMAKHAQAFAQQ